jgi:hypothetical protein
MAKTIRQILPALAVIAYMMGATSGSMPKGFPLKPAIDKFFGDPFRKLGLTQRWDMFSPEPKSVDVHVMAEVTFADGRTTTVNLSKMDEYGFLARYQRNRWRKFFNDHVRLDRNSAMWEPVVRNIARNFESHGKSGPISVVLLRYWRLVRKPDDSVESLPSYFNRGNFYRWKAEP